MPVMEELAQERSIALRGALPSDHDSKADWAIRMKSGARAPSAQQP
jgi:hypothetical protein